MTLLERIEARKQPVQITERMSPFMRRLAERNLPVTDKTGWVNGAATPSGSGGAA